SRRRHTRSKRDWSSDVCSSDLVTDPSTRVAGIQSGEYDIAQEVPYDNADQLDADENVENQIIPGAGTLIMFMNKKTGPFKDVKRSEERRVGKECRTRRWRSKEN